MRHGPSLSKRHPTAPNVPGEGRFPLSAWPATRNHPPLRPRFPRQEFGALPVWVSEGPGDKRPRDWAARPPVWVAMLNLDEAGDGKGNVLVPQLQNWGLTRTDSPRRCSGRSRWAQGASDQPLQEHCVRGTTVKSINRSFTKLVRKSTTQAPRPGVRAALNQSPGQKHGQSGRVM